MKKINEINGHEFHKAISSGIINVISKQDYLNSINVFPVPDGDTGTNLMFTLRPIIQIEEDDINENIEKTLLLISDTALNTARGNSGTIIAQYFIGLADGVKDHQSINSENISQILESGFKAAQSSMMDPKEGTIISVMRDISKISFSDGDMLGVIKKICTVSKKSLQKTPDQMKLLKDSGVVDAGAAGLVDMFDGFLYYLENDESMHPDIKHNLDLNEKNESFIKNIEKSKFQYCTECIIIGENLERTKVNTQLNEFGDSLILAGNKEKIKIHIHTNSPDSVFDICSKFGEIKNQKADDMHQQSEEMSKSRPSIAIVTDSGCDVLYDSHNANIHMVPVRYSFGDVDYLDKVSQSSEEFYNELVNNPIHPKTSQPPTGDFISMYKNLSSDYKSIISIHIPNKLSGTLQSSKNAINKIEDMKITPIDSKNASVGLGLIVQSASQLSEKCDDHDVLVSKIEKLIKNTKIFLTVKDINFSIKGGRVPKYKGYIAKLLNMHPVLTTNEDGELKAASAFFGKNNLHEKLAQYVIGTLDKNLSYKFSVSHSNSPHGGEQLVDYIQNNFKNVANIDLVDMGSGLGVHAGPGSFGVAYQLAGDE